MRALDGVKQIHYVDINRCLARSNIHFKNICAVGKTL